MEMQQYRLFWKDSQLNDELDLIKEGTLAPRLPGQPLIRLDDSNRLTEFLEKEYSC
jgi:hypothetical protein